jgi:hypothetical protein
LTTEVGLRDALLLGTLLAQPFPSTARALGAVHRFVKNPLSRHSLHPSGCSCSCANTPSTPSNSTSGFCHSTPLLISSLKAQPSPAGRQAFAKIFRPSPLREKTRKEREARTSKTDFTRFDIRLGDEAYPSMWKRNAIFLICKRLCDMGTKPEEIISLFDWRPNRVWYSVDGTVDAAEFETRAAQKATSNGSAFSTRRWFCGDDELVHSNGKTYPFSNQWAVQTGIGLWTF